MALTEKQRKVVLKKAKAIVDDPAKAKREILAAARKANPGLTKDEIEAGEGVLKAVFGL